MGKSNNISKEKTSVVEEKILLAGKNGKTDLDFKFALGSNNKISENILKEVNQLKANMSMNKDFETDMKAVKNNLIDANILSSNGDINERRVLAKGNFGELQKWASNNPNLIAEIADDGRFRVFSRKSSFEFASSQYVEKDKLETADDDRVLGIPYAQAMAGDRVYIINGKVFTGWSLYFSLSSIRSPEDYARNVDLVWNVPYLYASILMKAQLALGCGLDVNYGAESLEVPEESLVRRYLFDRLRINVAKLVKTGFYLHTYGNAYWALRRDGQGLVNKITQLQPERVKIFLDPMTTKILFYIYLPPIIGGTTIASYPDDGRVNPNVMTGVTLSYPTPIVLHPQDVMHFKLNDFTEYPFGFSDIRTCIDPATARLDINILAPILFKKYTKPMIHWALNTEGLGSKQVGAKLTEMTDLMEDMEPGSDPITTDRWRPTVITVGQGKGDILDLTSDVDTQIFAATGVPETYFKSRGSTDRMISEQDKTFLSRLKVPQAIVAEQIEDVLIKPRIYHEIKQKREMKAYMGETDAVEEILQSFDSWMASEPKYPKVVWKEIFKQDETQSIANAIALLNAGVIDKNRAAMKVGEIPPAQQQKEDMNKEGIDDPLTREGKVIKEKERIDEQMPTDDSTENTPDDYNEQENMENLRGGLNAGPNFSTNNRNVTQVQDPSQLGGSRYQQHKLKGEEADIKEKHTFQEGDEIDLKKFEDGTLFVKKK